jgi:hypothetical protein
MSVFSTNKRHLGQFVESQSAAPADAQLSIELVPRANRDVGQTSDKSRGGIRSRPAGSFSLPVFTRFSSFGGQRSVVRRQRSEHHSRALTSTQCN